MSKKIKEGEAKSLPLLCCGGCSSQPEHPYSTGLMGLCSQIDFPVGHHFGNFRVVVRQEKTFPRIEGRNEFHIIRA